jgi:sugar O-acyltransferase (sialic acid O-acetyltransferase NeuD family)
MIIVGAGGFAKEVLSCISGHSENNIVFYDDVNPEITHVFDSYEVLKSEDAVKAYFKSHDDKYTIGIGNPGLRRSLYDKFTVLGGSFSKVVSDLAFLGTYNVELSDGVVILPGVNISNNTSIGKGTMIYYNSTITHDCHIGEFVEIAPGVQVLGRVKIDSYSSIGAAAVILPDVHIGENVIIGAGAVVTKDIPDNSIAMGIPARVVKKMNP